MLANKDAFERAVEREGVLRQRSANFYSSIQSMKIVRRFFGAMLLAWGLLVAVHWLWLSDPRWLVVLHTIFFAITAGWMLAAMAFTVLMGRRRANYLRD